MVAEYDEIDVIITLGKNTIMNRSNVCFNAYAEQFSGEFDTVNTMDRFKETWCELLLKEQKFIQQDKVYEQQMKRAPRDGHKALLKKNSMTVTSVVTVGMGLLSALVDLQVKKASLRNEMIKFTMHNDFVLFQGRYFEKFLKQRGITIIQWMQEGEN